MPTPGEPTRAPAEPVALADHHQCSTHSPSTYHATIHVLTTRSGEAQRSHRSTQQEPTSSFMPAGLAANPADVLPGDQRPEHERRARGADVSELPVQRTVSSRRYGSLR